MMTRTLLTTAALLACSSSLFAADAKGEVFTDPAAAGTDFAFQGEYAAPDAGAQVIALGEGKFRIVGWANGLPGTSGEVEKHGETDGQLTGDKVVFAKEGWKGQITAAGELSATDDDGNTHRLKKTERTSPTAGAKPPAGALVLFDGSNADAWQGGKVDANGLLNAGVKTKQAFGDCTLHLEFRTPFMPKARGQARGNSGCYLQDRHEVQILDSFGLSGENNECGGIYTVAKPRINMCFPPLSWQTYDIDFTVAKFDAAGTKTKGAIITVRHNGVLIHDAVEVGKVTGGAGAKDAAGPGPIQLQDHGNPVVFRNIWLVEKK